MTDELQPGTPDREERITQLRAELQSIASGRVGAYKGLWRSIDTLARSTHDEHPQVFLNWYHAVRRLEDMAFVRKAELERLLRTVPKW